MASIFTIIFFLLTLSSLAFYVLNLIAAWSFLRQKSPANGFAPGVSILKPLKGCDPQMYEAFRSHCLQDYPDFEIIFGVNTPDDAAVEYVEKLRREFSDRKITLKISDRVLGANGKISNLAQMITLAQYPFVLINDSDIRVPPNYLCKVMAWFEHDDVGMVTCLYRVASAKSIWAKLEALGVAADFMPGALSARFLDGEVRFALGSTMAIRRSALEKIGGLEPIVNHLADDYQLGVRIVASGSRVVVPDVFVETTTPDYDFNSFFQHQLRWGRTVRSSRPGGYFGLLITFGLVWSIALACSSHGAALSGVLLATVIGLRLATVGVYSRILNDNESVKNSWLLPIRDFISPLVWLLSITGNRIVWRGEVFQLKKGKLTKSNV